jgi:sterol desaturase/sphingolipid hydroxylase (fatty acid hydroxylase superfamily)
MDIKKEQELQAQVESGQANDSTDAKAYRLVYRVLSRDPGFALSAAFIHQVMARVEARRLKEMARDRWFLISGWIVFLVAFIVCIAKVKYKLGLGSYTFLQSYAGLLAFAVVFLLILHLIDRRIIRPKLNAATKNSGTPSA